ncbi:MAG: hypothetical protein WBL37_06315 [Dehalococcoidales bacterium]
MTKDGDVIILTAKEAQELVNKECLKRLGMNLLEYKEKKKKHELPKNSIAVHDIELMLEFA